MLRSEGFLVFVWLQHVEISWNMHEKAHWPAIRKCICHPHVYRGKVDGGRAAVTHTSIMKRNNMGPKEL